MKLYNKFFRILTIFFVIAITHNVLIASTLTGAGQFAQAIVVTGLVSDGEGPVPGVNVMVRGTTIGVTTNDLGRYTITVPNNEAVLQFSFVGYSTVEEVVGNRTIIDVEISADASELDEIVVIGYGVQRRINVVGSVATLQGDEIRHIPAVSAAASISGRLPGVTVVQGSGEPGQLSPTLFVRGRSTTSGTGPLIIIDGVQGRQIGEIDPNDIASFSVLKDASAAIYGSTAANGVILITTKSGEARAGRPRLNFSFYQGFMTPSRIPEMCSSAEYATMLSEYEEYTGSGRTFTDAQIALFASGEDPWEHPNTDWYAELIRKWTTTTRYNLNIDGGSYGGMTYYVSLGYKQDDAMYQQSSTKYNQLNIRTKVNIPITDWLLLDVNITGVKTKRQFPFRGAGDIIGAATRSLPTDHAFWPTGEPGPDLEFGDNPVVTSSFASGKNDQDTYRLQNNLKVTISPPFVKGLSLGGSVDYDISNFYRKRFYHHFDLYYPDYENAVRDPATGFITSMPLTPQLRGPAGVFPHLENDYQRTVNMTIRIDANYNQSFGNHDISLYAGFEQYTNDYNEFWARREAYVSTQIQILNVGPLTNQQNSGRETIYARKSWIGRASYAYKSKYLAEVVFRRDGSLKFPPESRWGNFPGLMLGWRASEEEFWKNNLSFVNHFKLRASYGEMGMDPGDPFQYIDKYTLGGILGMVFGTDGVVETTTGPPTVANQIITWERQKTHNLGFEAQFMRGFLFLNVDYFYNIRDQILATRNASVPDFSGITLPDENIARVDNQGFEIEAGVRRRINEWGVSLSGNVGYSQNKVVYNDEPEPPVPWQKRTGKQHGLRLMYDFVGIARDKEQADAHPRMGTNSWLEGDVLFRNVSADYAHLDPEYDDNLINANDRILVENTQMPYLFYGANLDVSWRNFSLNVLLQGQGKHLKRNWQDDRRGYEGNYFKFMYNDRWTPENRDASMPRAVNFRGTHWILGDQNTLWWENCAYLRLKNVMLSYNIPAQYYNSFGISNINVYFSGNNLAYLWSATDKFDPESNGPNTYPTMRTFAIGANITF